MSDDQPLSGDVVIDLTKDHNAYTGKLLASFGADVIKVEPSGGDPARTVPPFTAERARPNASAFFGFLNTGKRSLVLDPDDDGDRGTVQSLISHADLLIEDHLEEYGFTVDGLRERHPGLIVVSLSGLGRSGSRAEYDAPELVASAMSGLMYQTGYRDRPPTRMGLSVDSYLGTITGAIGALLALRVADRVGGQHVDVSQQEAIVKNLEGAYADYSFNREIRSRTGNVHLAGHPYGQIYPAKDGYVCVSPVGNVVEGPLGGNEVSMWMDFCRMIDREDLLEDERFNPKSDEGILGPVKRLEYADELDEILREEFEERSAEEFYHSSQNDGITNSYVMAPADLYTNDHLDYRGFFAEIPTPNGEEVAMPTDPYTFSGGSSDVDRPPRLGEHTPDILDEIGNRPPESAREGHPDRDDGDDRTVQPLDGIRVLDFTQIWAGPSCTKILSDHGADVIKVESKHRMDFARAQSPLFEGKDGDPLHGEDRSGYYFPENHGKRSLTVNLQSDEGRALIEELITEGDVDVVVEAFSAGTMDDLGLGYDDLRESNEDLVMCSISGFGQEGPESHYRGVAAIMGPLSGIAHATGFPDDAPLRSGISFIDPVTGLYAAFGIIAALKSRDERGEGQYIDISMQEVGATITHQALTYYDINGENWERIGNRDERERYIQGCYRCSGGDTAADIESWVAIVIRDQTDWQNFREVLGYPDWASDDRFASQQARLTNHDGLDGKIEAWTEERGRYEVVDRLQEAGVPAGVVQTTRDLLEEDDALDSRGFWEPVRHPVVGTHPFPSPLPPMSETPGRMDHYAPMLGQHTREVLYDVLSPSGDRVAELEGQGVLE